MSTTNRSVHQGRHTDESRRLLELEMNKLLEKGIAKNWTQEQYKEQLTKIIKDEREALKLGKKNLYKDKNSE